MEIAMENGSVHGSVLPPGEFSRLIVAPGAACGASAADEVALRQVRALVALAAERARVRADGVAKGEVAVEDHAVLRARHVVVIDRVRILVQVTAADATWAVGRGMALDPCLVASRHRFRGAAVVLRAPLDTHGLHLDDVP